MIPQVNNNNNGSGDGSGSSADDLSASFLKLLVAQMQNQDPTNPMDNNQLTSQLAQFSTAAGVEKLNKSVADVQALMAQLGGMGTAAWVGRSILIEGDQKVTFGGTLEQGSILWNEIREKFLRGSHTMLFEQQIDQCREPVKDQYSASRRRGYWVSSNLSLRMLVAKVNGPRARTCTNIQYTPNLRS